MKITWRVVAIIGIVAALCWAGALLLPGCGRGDKAGAEAPTPRETPMVKADLPLPEWAPANPSPEFLRAARVLKPIPEEFIGEYAQGDVATEAAVRRGIQTYPSAYEFFGTMSDDQVKRFLISRGKGKDKEIRIAPGSLTVKQRAALDKWFEVWRQVMKDTEHPDFLVLLYKCGAKEDLSNIQVGFAAHGGHAVHIKFWIKLPNGEEIAPCSYFATI